MDGVKRVRIQDVARAAGVSPSTVSAVINDKCDQIRISASTREKVLAAARELNFNVNVHARRMASSAAANDLPVIGIFWEAERFLLSLKGFLDGINRYMEQSGHEYEYLVCPYSGGKLNQKERQITSGLYHGMIFVGLTDEDDAYLHTLRINVPYVYFNRERQEAGAILVDNYAVGRLAASCLLEHSPNYMAQISPLNLHKRREGIRRAAFFDKCLDAGVQGDRFIALFAEDSLEGGYAAAKDLFSRGISRVGLFVTSDTVLLGVLHYLVESRLRMPEDVLLVSYGSDNPSLEFVPRVATICSPIMQMSHDCMEMIDHMLRGESLQGLMKMHQPILNYGRSFSQSSGC